LAVTDAFPLSEKAQVFAFCPPLLQAPDQMTSRPLVALSVMTVPTVKDADCVLPTATLMPPGLESTWVFPSDMGDTPIDGQNFVNRVFLKALRKARIHDFSWHCLRHTFASRLVMAGVDLRTVHELMGHKTMAMTLRYSHLFPPSPTRRCPEAGAAWRRGA
jgi:integrase